MNSELAKIASKLGTARKVTEQGGLAMQRQMKLQGWQRLISLARDILSQLSCVNW